MLLRFSKSLVLAVSALTALASSVPAHAEKMPSPKSVLRQEPFILEVTVLSVEEKPGPHAGSSVWHRVRIDRVERGDGLKVGDETAVVSRVYDNPPGTAGTNGHRGDWRGPNGLPAKGDRARLFASGSATTLQPHFTNGWQPVAPRVAFVAADDEYRSEITMPFLAELVAKPLGIAASTHLASDDGTTPKVEAKTQLTDARTLGGADAIVAFMRFEQLGDSARREFLEPLDHGVPLVAFRTSTHAFAYPAESPEHALNDGFGAKFIGSPWRFHHGHSSRTRVLAPTAEAAKHPILAGVAIPPEGIVVPSWLYHVEPLPADCTVLLWGEAIDSERKDAPQKQPILWVRNLAHGSAPQRIAYTSLGHPGDFANAEFRVIAAQMVAFVAGRSEAIDDADRAAIRAAAFSPPSTR